MIDTVLFDLDGTLLPIAQDDFIALYFKELSAMLARIGIEPKSGAAAIWAGTEEMIKNDGAQSNRELFWRSFSSALKLDEARTREVEALCDGFYSNEFNKVKALMPETTAPARAVNVLKAKGYTVALPTNPIFPRAATVSRLGWLGLKCEDFVLVTDYANSSFCKPNLDYYRDVLAKIGRTADRCLMVGNSVSEDMCVEQLGMQTFLVTGFVEGANGADTARFRSGSIEEFALFAEKMPVLGRVSSL